MPRFENTEPRVRGFNNNKIVFGPGEARDVSAEDLELLRKDISFQEVVKNGKLRDLDNAAGLDKKQQPSVRDASSPSTNVDALLTQISTLQDEAAVADFAAKLPSMNQQDFERVSAALTQRKSSFGKDTKKK